MTPTTNIYLFNFIYLFVMKSRDTSRTQYNNNYKMHRL